MRRGILGGEGSGRAGPGRKDGLAFIGRKNGVERRRVENKKMTHKAAADNKRDSERRDA
jgi:hypothetical protein